MVERTIRLYLVLNSLYRCSISFVATTYVLFLTSRGLNFLEANLVNTVFMVTLFFAEVPTGAIADTWGRKTSFITACLLMGMSMFLYYIAHSFWGFALAEAVGAVGATCATGAFQAWFVDTLRYHGHRGLLETVFVRESQVGQLSMMVGALLGAYLGSVDLALPWLVGCGMFATTAVIASMAMREDYFERKSLTLRSGITAVKDTVRESVRYGKSSASVSFLLVLSFAFMFATQGPNMQWQPRFVAYVAQQSMLGWFWVAMALSLFIGATIARWFLQKMKGEEQHALLAVHVLVGGSLFLSGWGEQIFVVVSFFLFHEVWRGSYKPLKDAYLNRDIPSKERSTILSLEAMSSHIGAVFGLLVSGVVAQYVSIRSSWMISGALLALSASIVLRKRKKK